jgi:hypothetical protein
MSAKPPLKIQPEIAGPQRNRSPRLSVRFFG